MSNQQIKVLLSALTIAEDMLRAGGFAGSFDMLLAASRLAPSDPKLYDMVVRFVDQASDRMGRVVGDETLKHPSFLLRGSEFSICRRRRATLNSTQARRHTSSRSR